MKLNDLKGKGIVIFMALVFMLLVFADCSNPVEPEPMPGIVVWWDPMRLTYTWGCPRTHISISLHGLTVTEGDILYSPMTGIAYYVKWVKWI